jgi:RNase P/RNase MRP subunit POP5
MEDKTVGFEILSENKISRESVKEYILASLLVLQV